MLALARARIDRRLLVTTAASAVAFAVAGGLSRYVLRMTESRLQIAAFGALAIAVEMLAAPLLRTRASWVRGCINVAAATVTIVLMKFHLEPDKKAADKAIVRHASQVVGRDLRRAVDR